VSSQKQEYHQTIFISFFPFLLYQLFFFFLVFMLTPCVFSIVLYFFRKQLNLPYDYSSLYSKSSSSLCVFAQLKHQKYSIQLIFHPFHHNPTLHYRDTCLLTTIEGMNFTQSIVADSIFVYAPLLFSSSAILPCPYFLLRLYLLGHYSQLIDSFIN